MTVIANEAGICELTEDAASQVSGGFLWTPIAVIAVGATLIGRELSKLPKADVPVLDLPTPQEPVR
jgi:hypothetical protein